MWGSGRHSNLTDVWVRKTLYPYRCGGQGDSVPLRTWGSGRHSTLTDGGVRETLYLYRCGGQEDTLLLQRWGSGNILPSQRWVPGGQGDTLLQRCGLISGDRDYGALIKPSPPVPTSANCMCHYSATTLTYP